MTLKALTCCDCCCQRKKKLEYGYTVKNKGAWGKKKSFDSFTKSRVINRFWYIYLIYLSAPPAQHQIEKRYGQGN